MTTDLKIKNIANERSKFSLHGWLGLGLMTVISVIASMIPAQNAARLTIRDALVYE